MSISQIKQKVSNSWGKANYKELKKDKGWMQYHKSSGLNGSLRKTWEIYYREWVNLPADEKNLPSRKNVINGIDIFQNFRPWEAFNLDRKTATKEDVKNALGVIKNSTPIPHKMMRIQKHSTSSKMGCTLISHYENLLTQDIEISAEILAKSLKIKQEKLYEICEKLISCTNEDEWHIKEGEHYKVLNKNLGTLSFTPEGVIQLAKYTGEEIDNKNILRKIITLIDRSIAKLVQSLVITELQTMQPGQYKCKKS